MASALRSRRLRVAGLRVASLLVALRLAAEAPGQAASPPPRPAALPFRAAIAAQTFLDRENLSCNCLDGSVGERTREAVKTWQENHGLRVTGQLDAATAKALGDVEDAFTTHVVSSNELASLTPVPETWLGKSQSDRLGYQTILELVAEKYHASEGAVRRLNPGVAWPDPPEGTTLVVPKPFPSSVSKAASIRIFLGRKLIQGLDGDGRVIAQFPCSIAREAAKRPVGQLKVIVCAANPNYVLDPAVFAEDAEVQALGRRLIIPPGPNNPVGMAWIGLDRPGYGMHGTPRPEDIGKTESHGCFRLANWNAQRLLKMVTIGMPVLIEP